MILKRSETEGNSLTRGMTDATIEQKGGAGSRSFELSFSSEAPYIRWFGPEVLDHSPEAVNLERVNAIGCLLFNHERNQVIGKVKRAWLGDDRRCHADVEFDKDEASERIFQKVQGGTLKGVSVSYTVSNWEDVAAGKASTCGRYQGPCKVAKRWEPLEVSIVSVPADPGVGVGRAGYETEQIKREEQTMEEKEKVVQEKAAEEAKVQERTVDTRQSGPDSSREAALQKERERTLEITALGREFGLDTDGFIRDGTGVDAVRAAILNQLMTEKKPVAARGTDVTVTKDEGDKVRDAAIHGIMLRSGIDVENPNAGAEQFRGMTLHNIAAECLRQNGVENPFRIDGDAMLRNYMTPASLFTSVLDSVVKEVFEKAYGEVMTTYQLWTRKGTLTNFKPTRSYHVGIGGELLPVPEGGELKHDTMVADKGPIRTLLTFGRQFSMTREAFINDDIDFIRTLPGAYAASAKMSINRMVYETLCKNPVVWDGKPFFDGDHRNLAGVSGKPSIEALADMRRKLRNQTGHNENLKLNTQAKFILVPTSLETEAGQLIYTAFDKDKDIAGVYNPFHRNLSIISDAEMDDMTANGDKEWYLTGPTAQSAIQVDFLNGKDMPTKRPLQDSWAISGIFIWTGVLRLWITEPLLKIMDKEEVE